MTGITRRLAEFAAGIDYASLGSDVAERTRMLLMDQVGISIRGRNDAGLSASMAAALRHLGLGSGNASVIGDGASYAPPAAALFNGNLGHFARLRRHPRERLDPPERADRPGRAGRRGDGRGERPDGHRRDRRRVRGPNPG